MDNSGLFSHPDVPQPSSSRKDATEPVKNPTFSDRPDTQEAQRGK